MGIKPEGLSYKRLVIGSLVLGQVTRITSRDVCLALPNNLVGYVPLTSISPTINQKVESLLEDSEPDEANSEDEDDIDLESMFYVGQYLRAYVTSTEGHAVETKSKAKRRIELSLESNLVNSGISKDDIVAGSMLQATVSSVEDHGLVLDLGLSESSTKGFMPAAELSPEFPLSKIQTGTVLFCLVTGFESNKRVVKLSCDSKKLRALEKYCVLDAPSIRILLPGTAVEVLVTESSETGVVGKVMGMLDVTADFVHCGLNLPNQRSAEAMKEGSKVRGRIICTFPNAEPPKMGVSFLDHVRTLQNSATISEGHPVMETRPLSSFVDAAKVYKVDRLRGLFVDVGMEHTPGFVHISRVSDKNIASLSASEGSFKIGSSHRARIIGFNQMDGVFSLAMDEKTLNEPFLRIEDLPIGDVLSGTVEKIVINDRGIGGVLVKLSDGIIGLVPEMHMSDVRLEHPEKRFREGMSVRVRVLSTNPERRLIRLTMKKSLVNSDATLFKDIRNIAPGDSSPGTIVSLLPTGAVVQFYGSVRAFLPVSEMSEAYIKDPAQHFRTGQVVNVHVLSVDPDSNKMVVSCRDPAAFGEAQKEAFASIHVGDLVKGAVTDKSSDVVTFRIGDAGIKATLHLIQLTDGSEKKCAADLKRLRPGQTLDNLVVLEKVEKRNLLYVSAKPSLVAETRAGSLIKAFEDVKEGKTVRGFVRGVSADGVFVQFAGAIVGFLHKSQLDEKALKLPDFGMTKGQSVSAKVLTVDPATNRFFLSKKSGPQPERSTESNGTDQKSIGQPVTNAVDGVSKLSTDYAVGVTTKARITAAKDTQLNVLLADNVQGRIDVSEVFDNWEDIKDRKYPLKSFHKGQILSVQIIGIHDARSHKFLPISHRGGKVPVFELTAKPKTLQGGQILSMDQLSTGKTYTAFVNNIDARCVWVNLSPSVRGRVDLMDLSDDLSLLSDVQHNFPIGSAVRVRVKSIDVESNRLDLSATSTDSSEPLTLRDLSHNMVIPGRVTKVTERYLMIQLSSTISGQVPLTELSDDFSLAKTSAYNNNDIVRACVLNVDLPNKQVMLSLRPSHVLSSGLPVRDPPIADISQIKMNDVRRGFVKNVSAQGVFVSLSPKVTAFVRVSELSDAYLKDWKSKFEVDQLVEGKVIHVDTDTNQLQLSLKESVLNPDYVRPLGLDDIKRGQVVTGKVRKVEDYGVFILVDNSKNVSGLCHRSEIADDPVKDVKSLYQEGDIVKAKVVKVDLEKRRVNFSLKASHFASEDEDVLSEAEDDMDDEETGGVEIVQEGHPVAGQDREDATRTDSVDVHMGNTESNGASEQTSTVLDRLKVASFDWTGLSLAEKINGTNDDSDGELSTKKKKRRKPEIKVDMTGDLDKYGPRSVADYERQLLGQPNSSSLWIQYMAFQLQLGEVDKARNIAERALRTINIREDDEKLNVWVAMLNLENAFGSDESMQETFQRACQYNDTKEMHERLASIYIESGKHDRAEDLFASMVKNKSISPDPTFWINYATFVMSTLNQPDRARALLQRATQSVPSDLHRQLTMKFAALEFQSRNGNAERGRTVFEGLVDTWPKKWDIWDVWMSLEKSKKESEHVRALYGRMSERKMKKKRAKSFFKQWFDWEESFGSEQGLEDVKKRAAAYVEKMQEDKDKMEED
ncbi:nucleic acid-binding protein [Eremomyces bilateralis CBS 781.70]|uniref:rRNA biogenesis protein RRP5 n=1 Tax=Eremomyces bilateralis CBS 781.70 TaxID=1392243 RepID=A0A6G1GAS4_9PEZI|nr:nucleic acid-binding protein [Eremomyces bilateralis CBS 781.70]KAF1815188.1 nucleic acid-binding protein [Eremomyces bilateralis CBS 781.70]